MVTTSSSRLASSPRRARRPIAAADRRQVDLTDREALRLGQQWQEAVLVAVDRELLGDLGAHRADAAADVVQGGAEQRVDRLIELASARRLLEQAPRHHEIGAVQSLQQSRQQVRRHLDLGRQREHDVAGGVAEAHGQRGGLAERRREGQDLDRLARCLECPQRLHRARHRPIDT